MAYLPNYSWDIFISYAHDDNSNVGPSRNWITKFYERLVPAIQSGVMEKLSVFFDWREQKTYNTIESILTEVQRSAIFVIIGSSNWVRSNWCQRELDTFLTHRSDTTRVFLAELDPPRGEFSYPKSVPDNLRLEFWKKSERHQLPIPLKSDERAFEVELAKMSNEIMERLIALKAGGGGHQRDKHTVFLAYSTDDVEEEREELRDYLEGLDVDVDVLPREAMPSDPKRLQAIVDEGLSRSTIFVQLLGRRKAKPLAGSEISPTFLQSEAAERKGGQIFRWRPDDVDPLKNPDDSYRPLLMSAQNGTPNELGQAIVKQLEERLKGDERLDWVKQREREPGLLNVVINADPADRERAQELFDACKGKNCEVMLDECDNNELARSQWADASAVAYIQGEVGPGWLMARWSVFKRARRNGAAGADLRGQAVVFAPPPENKARGRIYGPRLEEIDLSEDWNVLRFEQWIDRLSQPDAPTD
ncbi:MAG TPA: toll/interleukin-1 receptor domain-containing protein [Allosphingosinicella sp.]|nr:toll/interleukin-1 receptor domain-containing protein [Allosphingosinicella sp.]